MKKLFIVSFLLISFAIPASAEQSFEDYVNKQFGEFQKFKEERDKEFTEFLKNQWKKFNAFKGIDPDPVPKPDKIPQAEPQAPKDIPDSPKITEKEIPKTPKPEPVEKIKPVEPVEERSEATETSSINFDFFDTKISVNFDKNISETFGATVNNDKISKYWEKLSTADYNPLAGKKSILTAKPESPPHLDFVDDLLHLHLVGLKHHLHHRHLCLVLRSACKSCWIFWLF